MAVLAELDPDIPGKIKLQAEYRWKELIKTLPGSKYSNPKFGDAWRVPLTWQSCLALRTTFGADLVLGENLTKWATEYRQNVVDPAMYLRQQIDADGYKELFPFQRAGVRFMATTGRALLTDGLGAGKTRQALSVLRFLYENGQNPFPVLVVAPNSTLISWSREAEEVWPGLKVNVIKGTMAKRRKLLEEKAHIYVINWEGIRAHSRLAPYGGAPPLKKCLACSGADPDVKESTCQSHPRELNAIDFNTVIADEVHRAKDPSSQQTRALKAATADAKFRFGLSGTPIASSPDDLWSPLNWLLPEAYPSRTKYTDRFLDISYNAWGQASVMGVKQHMEAEFFAGLDPHLRHMPKDVVLSFLPPVIRERRDVEMSPKQLKAYKQMRDQMVTMLDDKMLVSLSPLTKMTRMLQFASSYAEIVSEEGVNKKTGETEIQDTVKLIEPSCKLDAFMDDIEDFGDESVIVFAVSRQLIEMLSARMTKLKIPHGLITGKMSVDQRQEHMDAFQRGETKYILCTIAAGGTGITLTKGSIMVFLQRSWSMIENTQAEGRGHRIGSQIHDVVRIIDYVTIDSAEEVVHQAVAAKGEQLEKILRSKELQKLMLLQNSLDDEEIESVTTLDFDAPSEDELWEEAA